MRLTEENIGDYAQTLVERAKDGGAFLDFSEASVGTLEGLIQLSDASLQSPDLPTAHRDLVIFYNGCYLGEVLARNLNGVWQFAEAWPESTLTFRRADGTGVQVRPFEKMFFRVTEGPDENNLVAYYNGLKEYLAPDTFPRP